MVAATSSCVCLPCVCVCVPCRSWYDLVATFPRLALRFQKRLLPKPSRANWYKSAQVVSRPVAAAPDNQHKLLNGDGGAAATAHAPCDEDQEVSMLPVKPQSEGSVDTHRGRDQDAEPTTASKASTNKDKGKDKLPLEPVSRANCSRSGH